jgi:hypothetical protein
METKNDLTLNSDQQSPAKTSIFDIDDLSFFRFGGLGLRHVELELGLREAVSGNSRGDAVSLACFGHNPEDLYKKDFVLDSNLCAPFQEKLEAFILKSYEDFHSPSYHYNDAAFLLVNRGEDARFPYDFGSYPLGKCGTRAFTAAQVMALMPTDGYVNDDINHAVFNTLMSLKRKIQQLKLHKAQELLEQLNQNSELQTLVKYLIEHYENDIFLQKPFFFFISKLCEASELDLIPLHKKSIEINDLSLWMQEVNTGYKKGKNSIKVLYQPDNFDSMDAQALSERLINYIKNQNLAKVRQCIKFLSLTGFNPAKDNKIPNPLQRAAHGESVDILKAVYEFEPNQYELLIENKTWTTPIYIAAHYGKLDNLKYLLSVRTLVARDLSFFNSGQQREEHIFLGVAASTSANSYEVMKLLETYNIGYGFDSQNNELYGNPLSITARVWSDGEINKKKFDLLLPHADAWAKYTGILSVTNELYYSYKGGPRKEFHYEDERANILFEYRNCILASLTVEECKEIRALVNFKEVLGSYRAKEILMDDLLNFEVKINPESIVTKNIERCFTGLEKKETISVSKVPTTLFHHKPEITVQSPLIPVQRPQIPVRQEPQAVESQCMPCECRIF